MIWIILVILFLVAGIILLSGDASFRAQTREQFLESLKKFVQGRLEPIENLPDGYRIRFTFEGHDFVYEDVPEPGFYQKNYKSYLKSDTGSPFTLYFMEKPRSAMVKLDVVIISQIPKESLSSATKVLIPVQFKDLDVQTNHPQMANQFFSNEKIVSILARFKSEDFRGYPSLSFKIIDGVVILEFHSLIRKNPNRYHLTRNIASMEDYLIQLLKIVSYLKSQKIDIH